MKVVNVSSESTALTKGESYSAKYDSKGYFRVLDEKGGRMKKWRTKDLSKKNV